MVRHLVGVRAAAVLMVGSVLFFGCTQSSTISSGNSTASFSASITSPSPGRWEIARLGLFRALVTALDPDAFANLGSSTIDMVPSAQPVDLRTQGTAIVFQTPLHAGEYRLESIYWVPPTLGDQQADPNAPTCMEKIGAIPPPTTTGIQVFATAVPLNPPIVFTATPGGTVRIRLEIDAEAMVEDYLSRWTCVDDPNGRCQQALAPCLSAYDSFGFGNAIPQFVTVTVE